MFLAGEAKSQSNPILIKLDENGQLEWKQVYKGTSGSYRAYSVCLSGNDGYILAGRTHDAEGFVLATNQIGEMKWMN